MARKILVVDDNKNVQVMLTDFLTAQGFEVETASDGSEALDAVRKSTPDLVLLDIMMPKMDGYQFIQHMRRASSLPVIMITARNQQEEIIRGFDLGADDYITKPFQMRELLVRIRAVLRRSTPAETDAQPLEVGDLVLDIRKHELKKDGHLVELTHFEFKLLEILMRSAGQVLKRADVCMYLMDNGFAGSEATLKIHIHNLRAKLDDEIDRPRYIETVFGIGYRFCEPAE